MISVWFVFVQWLRTESPDTALRHRLAETGPGRRNARGGARHRHSPRLPNQRGRANRRDHGRTGDRQRAPDRRRHSRPVQAGQNRPAKSGCGTRRPDPNGHRKPSRPAVRPDARVLNARTYNRRRGPGAPLIACG